MTRFSIANTMQTIEAAPEKVDETESLYERIHAYLNRLAHRGITCIVCHASYWTPGVSTIDELSPVSRRCRIGHLGCISCGHRMWFELPDGMR